MKKVALVSFVLLSFVPVVRGMESSQEPQYEYGVGALLHRVGGLCCTPLMWAVHRGDTDKVLELLLKNPMMIDLTAALRLVQEDLDRSKRPIELDYRGSEMFETEQLRRRQEVIVLLRDAERKAKLMLAVYRGDPETVRALFDQIRMSDLTAVGGNGRTVLQIAQVYRGDCVRVIQKGCNRGFESYFARRLRERQEVVRLLEDAKNRFVGDAERKAKK